MIAFPEHQHDSVKTHVFSGLNKYPTPAVTVNVNHSTIRGFGFRQSRGHAGVNGAIYVSINGGVRVENCEFSDNSVGISVLSGSVSVDDCDFHTATTTSNGAGTAILFQYVLLMVLRFVPVGVRSSRSTRRTDRPSNARFAPHSRPSCVG